MLTKLVTIGLAILSLNACSSLSKKDIPHPISLEQIEKLSIESSTANDLLHLFGEPNEIDAIEDPRYEIWIYKDYFNENFSYKAQFRIEKKTGLLMHMIWDPDLKSELLDAKKAAKYFKNCHFKKIKIPLPKGADYVSDDFNLIDQKCGVTILVISSDTVMGIGFRAPQSIRTPAVAPKK